jgi:hypothetical protein
MLGKARGERIRCLIRIYARDPGHGFAGAILTR